MAGRIGGARGPVLARRPYFGDPNSKVLSFRLYRYFRLVHSVSIIK
jgi:hypothetical protein